MWRFNDGAKKLGRWGEGSSSLASAESMENVLKLGGGKKNQGKEVSEIQEI